MEENIVSSQKSWKLKKYWLMAVSIPAKKKDSYVNDNSFYCMIAMEARTGAKEEAEMIETQDDK